MSQCENCLNDSNDWTFSSRIFVVNTVTSNRHSTTLHYLHTFFLRYRPIEHLQPGSILLEQTYAVDP